MVANPRVKCPSCHLTVDLYHQRCDERPGMTWDNPNSDPLADIEAAAERARQDTGVKPNTVVFGVKEGAMLQVIVSYKAALRAARFWKWIAGALGFCLVIETAMHLYVALVAFSNN